MWLLQNANDLGMNLHVPFFSVDWASSVKWIHCFQMWLSKV